MSRFETILLEHSKASWNWALVSGNPSVSFDFILRNSQLPWIPKYVSSNVNVSEKDVLANLEYPWDFEGLCMNPNLSLEFFESYIIKPESVKRVDWHLLSCNPSITMIDVINHPKYSWNDRYLSMNPNLSSNYILNEGKDRKWFIPFVCSNAGISERDIFKSTMRSMFEWDYRNLSANPNLPIAYVNKNMSKDWNYHSISTNASITDINSFQKVKWDSHGLSMNSKINFQYVEQQKQIKWDYSCLLSNGAIRFEDILNNISLFRSNVNNSHIETYLCSNPTITNQWIDKNESVVDWERLSSNPLN